MIKLLLTVSLWFWAVMSANGLSYFDRDYQSQNNKSGLESTIGHSFDWQSILAMEEFAADIKSKHQSATVCSFATRLLGESNGEPLPLQRDLPSSNALKVFSLYHQFF